MTRSRNPRNRAKAKAARLRRLTRERRNRRRVRMALAEPLTEGVCNDAVLDELRRMAMEGHEDGGE